MTASTKRKVAPEPAQATAAGEEQRGPLATYYAEDVMRDHAEWAYLFGPGAAREPTEAERALYEERLNDPAFGALHAMAERARAGEDISPLPVVVLDGGAPLLPEPGPYDHLFRPAREEPGPADLPAFVPVLDEERGPDGTTVIPVAAAETETFGAVPEGDEA